MSVGSEEVATLAAFRVGSEEYVIDIMRVREIIRPMPITPVRKGPRFVEGVITLRGAIIPIVDMRRRFDLPVEASNTQERIIIMIVEGRALGLYVDSVTEVVRVPRGEIRPAPGLLESSAAPYFLGVCRYHGRNLVLLNVKNIIASDEAIDVTDVAELAVTDVAALAEEL